MDPQTRQLIDYYAQRAPGFDRMYFDHPPGYLREAAELAKEIEEFARGRLSELAARFSGEQTARGEMVLVIDRTVIADDMAAHEPTAISIAARVAALEAEGLNNRAALKRAARELGMSRDEAYRRLVAERAQEGRE